MDSVDAQPIGRVCPEGGDLLGVEPMGEHGKVSMPAASLVSEAR
jgi:hypothetical protein